MAAKLESFHSHLLLKHGCTFHFSSESCKNLRNQVKCRISKAHVQCLPVLHHHLLSLLTSLYLRHHSQQQRRHHLLLRHQNPLASTPATFRLANSADISAITYPSSTFLLRRLDGTSVPASAVSAISILPGFLYVGITVSDFSMPSAFPHYRKTERQTHEHGRQTYTRTEPQDHRNDEQTENRKKDHTQPDNRGETVS